MDGLVTVPLGARRAIRRAVAMPCEIVTPHADEPIAYRATDLSPFGMWIATDEPLRTGAQVVVCFEPRGSWHHGELMLFAEVARVATSRRPGEVASGMGLEVLDLEARERLWLEAWLGGCREPVPRRRRPVAAAAPALAADVAAPAAALGRQPVAYRALGGAWR
jgi:hypothetical protein